MRLSDDHGEFSWTEDAVSARSGWFSVSFREPLPAAFSLAANELNEAGSGSRTLQTDSGAVTITLVMAKKGELHISIRLQQPPDNLNEVRLFFNRQQSELPGLFL